MQTVNWTGSWTIESGCVERQFTLFKAEGRTLPRFRAQIQGFCGGIDELYLVLQNVDRAIEGDFHRMLSDVTMNGRAVFSIPSPVSDDQIVVAVERDPKDLIQLHFERFVEHGRIRADQPDLRAGASRRYRRADSGRTGRVHPKVPGKL